MFEASPRTARHRGARFLTAVDVVRKPCGDATAGNHSEAGEEMESDGTSRRESLECRSRREPMQFGSDARGKRNTRNEGRRGHALAQAMDFQPYRSYARNSRIHRCNPQ